MMPLYVLWSKVVGYGKGLSGTPLAQMRSVIGSHPLSMRDRVTSVGSTQWSIQPGAATHLASPLVVPLVTLYTPGYISALGVSSSVSWVYLGYWETYVIHPRLVSLDEGEGIDVNKFSRIRCFSMFW